MNSVKNEGFKEVLKNWYKTLCLYYSIERSIYKSKVNLNEFDESRGV